MSQLPTRNRFFRMMWTADAFISSAVFETLRAIKSAYWSYSAWLYRWFRISGLQRVLVDLIDDGFTFGVVICFALLAYAVPRAPDPATMLNNGREYAITFTDSDGNIIGRRGIRQNDNIPLNEIPPVLIKAVLATEDARFYDHFGVDVIGTLRAMIHNTHGGSKQGGSSITQQVVKNILLTPERTMQRKVHEAFLSLWLEERFSKDQILKLYLDRAYMGGGTYGVEAASQFYFGKSVRDINLPEAAVLAGLFKAPTQYAPHANPEASRARSDVVLYRMLDAGAITQGELLQAKRNPAQIVEQNILASPNWFLDFAYKDTLDVLKRQNIKNDYVLEVKTTINTRLQNASQAILNDVIDNIGPDRLFTQASSVTMSPDGAVRQIVGGRDYEDSQFNRVTNAYRQTGSSFKPFVYLTALLKGYTPETIVIDGPVCVGNWCVHNFSPGFRGAISLKTALTHSINTIAVKLLLYAGNNNATAGRKKVEETARLVGITGNLDPYATMAIGTSALTLMDLSTGYATIANGGKLAHPYAVQEIRRPDGSLIYNHDTNEKDLPQVVPAAKIAQLVTMMRSVVTSGTATAADLGFEPVAGKTGTNANFRDAWFMGFTGHYLTGVWVGNDDNSPMASSKGLAVTGGVVPAPAWKRIMSVAEFGLKPIGIPGVPLDGSYSAPPTSIPDPALPNAVAEQASPQVASNDEATALAATADAGEQADTDSKDILNNMIDMFQPTSSDTAAAAPRKKPRIKQAQAPAPKAQRKSLFELLFGRH
ncbi:transglycosylase domain-containing protein [Aestuariivirga litoralis]|uniref:transglycosylase domain-containing protein n=1 Tax=Aestuariivirga litoralis TaxID=2650924 RepID=UPI0018C59845|nr:PBP1A family penicillin-binding protein [Aestuariivirga litoralis]MBG1232249.1 PBP1A family penicillin-binding protein [Aestuariivirga litoralis]